MRSRNPGWVPAQWVCSWLRPVALLSQARVCAALAGSNPASTIMWSAPRSASVSLSRENPSVAKSSISRNGAADRQFVVLGDGGLGGDGGRQDQDAQDGGECTDRVRGPARSHGRCLVS